MSEFYKPEEDMQLLDEDVDLEDEFDVKMMLARWHFFEAGKRAADMLRELEE